MKKLLVCDALLDSGLELLKKADDIVLIQGFNKTKEELYSLLEDIDVAITRSSTDVDLAFLERAKNLKALVRAGVGVDNIDIKECSKRGIVVMNVPTANTIAAIELSFAHLITSARSFTKACNFLKQERKWDREKFYGIELFNKTLGIIGFGNIGSGLALRAQAFGMKILAYDPYVLKSKIQDLKVSACSLDELLEQSDFISIHTPKTKETQNIINKENLHKLKDGVRLINVARGGLFNEEALYQGLVSSKIAWLGIDVFEKEPDLTNKLLDLENVSVTSHLGANTIESQNNISIQACKQALNAIRNISYENALNLPIQTEVPKFLNPYIELISKIAFLASSMNSDLIKEIELNLNESLETHAKALLSFACVGVLSNIYAEKINYINYEFIAKEKDIKLSLNFTTQKDLSLKIYTDKDLVSVSGAVFHENELRILSINDFKTDFKPSGKMVIFKNKDIPGVIALISNALASKNINIADFRLSRNSLGFALAVALLDEKINQNIIQELSQNKAFVFVKYIEL